MPFGSLWLENGGLEQGPQKKLKKGAAGNLEELVRVACLPLKKRIFDPLLPQRLAEFDIASNTPCVPEGTVADI